jgi:hypothetical protein
MSPNTTPSAVSPVRARAGLVLGTTGSIESVDGIKVIRMDHRGVRASEVRLAPDSELAVSQQTTLRAKRYSVVDNEHYGALLNASWNGLRPYLNRALFQAKIASKLDADAISRFPRDLPKILGLREGRSSVHEPGAEGFLLRCHAAMPFADAKVENVRGGEDRLRTDEMRRSFNTPFWPHVLATTSLGQEGLDFHVWCRQLLHWDLCASPIDLEQREGRIQRFGGLSVRSALADRLGEQIRQMTGTGASPWAALASYAEDQFQIDASGEARGGPVRARRQNAYSLSCRNPGKLRFNQLSQLRWLYRLALGQPHQQDFIETVSGLANDGRPKFALRLSAWNDEPEPRLPFE